ncbi:MAG: putative acetyltransferase [Labilithrix sp.]|nr:putative acetyltransferase [Labilithrix sp.]
MSPTLTPPALTGRHVALEPLAAAHAEPLLAAANASRSTYAFTIVPSTLDGMRAFIAAAHAEQERGDSLPFAVKDARGDVVGTTRYMAIEHWSWPGEPPPPVPTGPDVVEIGATWYAERVQRTAVNTEAKLLLCIHAFEHWKVRKVVWKTDERNARSRAAILRLGARFDGVLRAHRPSSDNLVRNTAFYSMLAAEWPAAKATLLDRLAS